MSKIEKIINGCEFQNGCIEYKDISYLKNMPICAIHELSIACHDKVNKCKYYQVYKQLKYLKQENDKYRQALMEIRQISNNHRLTVNKRNEQITKIIDELLED